MPFVAAADSARSVATVYTVSLLAIVPLLLAGIAALLLRRAGAQGRVLIWRSAVAALLLLFVGRVLPLHWMAWVVPSALAAPLVALGRVQVTTSLLQNAPGGMDAGGGLAMIRALLFVYASGVCVVLLPTVLASLRARRLVRRARELDGEWVALLAETCRTAGVS